VEEWRETMIKMSEMTRDSTLETAKVGHENRVAVIMTLKEYAMVWGDTHIYVRTDNFKQAHAIAKGLKVKLLKTTETDGTNYRGKCEKFEIDIYGNMTSPKCVLVQKERVIPARVEKYFEAICPGQPGYQEALAKKK
jgi:hypothetical protein